MFPSTKKEFLLILIGCGFLLAFLPASAALKCYLCAGSTCDDVPPKEEVCDDMKHDACQWETKPEQGSLTVLKGCGKKILNFGCIAKDPEGQLCLCEDDLCNLDNVTIIDRYNPKMMTTTPKKSAATRSSPWISATSGFALGGYLIMLIFYGKQFLLV